MPRSAVALGGTIALSGLANAATLVGTAGGAAPAPVLPVRTTPITPVTSPPPASAPGPVFSVPTVPITGVFEPMPVPLFPGVYPLQTSQKAVVVNWYDRSTDERSFIVYRRDAAGNWQNVYEVPTRDETGQGDDYSWVDTDTNQSGQCYMIAAVGTWGSGDTGEECTVRPDPAQFPQSFPSSSRQWFGLSGNNGGTGPLQTATRESYTSLIWSNETFGVNLGWSEGNSLWKVQAPGGHEVMYGEKVALRVWGGGWLKYGHQTWGVDLQLSDTPSFEWYIIGAPPGDQVDSEEFALWDSGANDYLVFGHQTWGVDLNWYKKTQPQNSPPPPPPGVKLFVAYNCIPEERPLEIWVEDLTAGTGFVDMAQLATAWDSEGSCDPGNGVWTFTPTSGHAYLVRSVDLYAPGCANDPTDGECWRSDTTFTGDSNGLVLSTPID